MINSDNVVRGGLTPKLKDIKTLLSILPFEKTGDQSASFGKMVSDNLVEYRWSDYEELRVFKVSLKQGEKCVLPAFKFLSIMIVVSGKANVQDNNSKSYDENHSTWYVMPE